MEKRIRNGTPAQSLYANSLTHLGAVLVAITFATGARAEPTLYAVNSTNCGCFFSVDLSSGEFVHIGPVEAQALPGGMAIDLDGTIYAVDCDTRGLLTIDPQTGHGTLVASNVGCCSSLAIAPVPVPGPSGMLPAGTAFASRQSPFTHDELIVVDKNTGVVTLIAVMNRNYYGLAFRADGVLFGAGGANSTWQLATLSTMTGVETVIGDWGNVTQVVGDLVFQPSGELLVCMWEGPTIWKVNQLTGQLSNPVTLHVDELCCEGLPTGMGYLDTSPVGVEQVTWTQTKGSYRQ